ncbi:MAG TPA: dienelactone hydrolase family protein [Acidimicrobiales bacterium]|jgi:carboxymethylenebutenolidase|nr:dienelactone hydrolase family protein [Acidimicrobiales bacterium]
MIISDHHVDLTTPSGPMRTYVYLPVEAGSYPGVVLYSEIFQQTGPVRRLASMLAGSGYLVAVPEIFHELEGEPGVVLSYDEAGAARGNADKVSKELGAYDADTRAVLDYLSGHQSCSGRLGAMGICIGGHLAFRAAFEADVRAAACFYATDIHSHSLGKGSHDDSLARVGEIGGELLMIWGRQDPHIPPEGRRMINEALNDARVSFTWHEFNGQHAFMRDEGARYDPVLARLGMDLALELFHRRLAVG